MSKHIGDNIEYYDILFTKDMKVDKNEKSVKSSIFSRFDKNGNGYFEAEEWINFVNYVENENELLKKCKKNSNNKVANEYLEQSKSINIKIKALQENSSWGKVNEFEAKHGCSFFKLLSDGEEAPEGAEIINISPFEIGLEEKTGKSYQRAYLINMDKLSDEDKAEYMNLLQKSADEIKQIGELFDEFEKLELLSNLALNGNIDVRKSEQEIVDNYYTKIRSSENPFFDQMTQLEEKRNELCHQFGDFSNIDSNKAQEISRQVEQIDIQCRQLYGASQQWFITNYGNFESENSTENQLESVSDNESQVSNGVYLDKGTSKGGVTTNINANIVESDSGGEYKNTVSGKISYNNGSNDDESQNPVQVNFETNGSNTLKSGGANSTSVSTSGNVAVKSNKFGLEASGSFNANREKAVVSDEAPTEEENPSALVNRNVSSNAALKMTYEGDNFSVGTENKYTNGAVDGTGNNQTTIDNSFAAGFSSDKFNTSLTGRMTLKNSGDESVVAGEENEGTASDKPKYQVASEVGLTTSYKDDKFSIGTENKYTNGAVEGTGNKQTTIDNSLKAGFSSDKFNAGLSGSITFKNGGEESVATGEENEETASDSPKYQVASAIDLTTSYKGKVSLGTNTKYEVGMNAENGINQRTFNNSLNMSAGGFKLEFDASDIKPIAAETGKNTNIKTSAEYKGEMLGGSFSHTYSETDGNCSNTYKGDFKAILGNNELSAGGTYCPTNSTVNLGYKGDFNDVKLGNNAILSLKPTADISYGFVSKSLVLNPGVSSVLNVTKDDLTCSLSASEILSYTVYFDGEKPNINNTFIIGGSAKYKKIDANINFASTVPSAVLEGSQKSLVTGIGFTYDAGNVSVGVKGTYSPYGNSEATAETPGNDKWTANLTFAWRPKGQKKSK